MQVEKIWSADDIDGDKVAGLDIGGTLTSSKDTGPTTKEINMALGLEEKLDKEIYRSNKERNGDIEDYISHAVDITNAIKNSDQEVNFKQYADTAQDLINDREILDGAEWFIDSLEDEGYHTVAISSAPAAVSYPLADKLGFSSFFVFRDYIFHDNEFMGVYVNSEAKKGKHQFVESLRENDVEVFYAGNGGNDVRAEKTADTGVRKMDWCSNPQEAYQEALKEAL